MALIDEFVVRIYYSTLEDVTTVNRARFEMSEFGDKDVGHLAKTRHISIHCMQPTQLVTSGARH